MNYQELVKRAKEVNLVGFIEKQLNRKLILVGLVGSQLFGLEDEKSDVDFVCYYLPTIEELVAGKFTQQSFVIPEEMIPNAGVVAYSANKIVAMLGKAPSDLMQVAATAKDFFAVGSFVEVLDEHFSLPSAEARAKNMFFYQALNNMKPAKKYLGSLDDFLKTETGVSLKAVARAYLFLSLYKEAKPYQKIKETLQTGFSEKEVYLKVRAGDYKDVYSENLVDLKDSKLTGDILKKQIDEENKKYKNKEKELLDKLSLDLFKAIYKEIKIKE